MDRHLAELALLPDGWARNVLLEVDAEGTLTAVTPDARSPTDVEQIGGVTLPGLANVHSHAFQRALAGRTERGSPGEDGFWSWRERMYEFLRQLDPEAVEAVASQLYVEMLEAGYTAVGEFHYLHHDRDGARYEDPAELSRRIVSAARGTGIGLTHLPVLYMTGGFGGAPAADGQRRFLWDPEGIADLMDALGEELEADADRRLGLGLHSLRAVPPAALRESVEEARRRDPSLPVHIHVAEQRREVEACLSWSGRRPVAWLLENAPVDDGWCLVHATHVVPDEIRDVAASGAVVGLCPSTEANLGDGFFPLKEHLDADGRLGIGSDSHVSVSPVEELRWLEYGQRLRLGERNVAAGRRARSTGRVLLENAVRGGDGALGRGAGALAPGRRADLVVLDADHPVLAGLEGDAVVDGWLFSGNVPLVRHVMVGGRWVVRDGRHPRRVEVAEGFREVVAGLG